MPDTWTLAVCDDAWRYGMVCEVVYLDQYRSILLTIAATWYERPLHSHEIERQVPTKRLIL
jgi:hypothetical protein